MTIRKLVCMPAFAVLVSGCASICCTASGPMFAGVERSSDADVTVYVYRPYYSVTAAAYRPDVEIDGVRTGNRLLNGGYVRLTLAPGRHFVGVGSTAFNGYIFKPGETYFARYEVLGGKSVEFVTEEFAVREMKTLRLSK